MNAVVCLSYLDVKGLEGLVMYERQVGSMRWAVGVADCLESVLV